MLHHLAEPKAALAILETALNEGGGMDIMVYGRYGRTGVYEAQQALRLLDRLDDGVPAGRPMVGEVTRSTAQNRAPRGVL